MPTGAPVGSISFVTGVDHRMFDQLFPLMGSMRRYCPGTRLWVCDFGLTGQQKDLLHRMGVLLEMPAGLGRYDHAWYYKGGARPLCCHPVYRGPGLDRRGHCGGL
jgi:hypothetical protein